MQTHSKFRQVRSIKYRNILNFRDFSTTHLAFVLLLSTTNLQAAERGRRKPVTGMRLEADGLEETAGDLDASYSDDERGHHVHTEEEDDKEPLAEGACLY